MSPTVLAQVAAGNSHPLIDIDGTIALQFGLFLVMFVVANKLLFQPYLQLRERRAQGIDGAKAEAERMSAEADAKLADYEKQLAEARGRAAAEQRSIRAAAVTHEQQVTSAAREAAASALEAARATVQSQTEAARRELLPRADALGKAMTKQLLGREVA